MRDATKAESSKPDAVAHYAVAPYPCRSYTVTLSAAATAGAAQRLRVRLPRLFHMGSALQEGTNQCSDLFSMRFQGEMPGVQQVYLCFW